MRFFNVNIEKRRDERFRYGQYFDYFNVDHMVERSPYAYFLTDAIVDEAINKGITINDTETEKVAKWNGEFQKKLTGIWGEAMKAFKFERRYGKASSIFFDNGTEDIILRSFSPIKYTPYYDKKFNITKIEATEDIDGGTAHSLPHELKTKTELTKVYEIIIREREKKGDGLSIIEPHWDTLYGLRLLDANSVRYAVKEGGGLFVAYVTEKQMKDKGYMEKLRATLRSIDSSNGTITIPIPETADGTKIENPFQQISGNQIDFIAIRDLLVGSLAAGTGIPREVWLGSELGLKSAETNQSSYFSVIQDIQQSYIPYFKWLVNTMNVKYKWFPEGTDFDIIFNTRDVMTKNETIDLMIKKADLIEKLRGKISDDELSTLVGMTLLPVEEETLPDEGDDDKKDGDEEEEDDDDEDKAEK